MSKVTVHNGQLVILDESDELPEDETPNEKTQSVIDWLAEDES